MPSKAKPTKSKSELMVADPELPFVISKVDMKFGGRNGNHTPHLSEMLEVMQVLPRTYPGTTW